MEDTLSWFREMKPFLESKGLIEEDIDKIYDFIDDQVIAARIDGFDNGYEEGSYSGYDSGYRNGYDDAKGEDQ